MTAHAVALQENERASIIDRAVEAADRQGARDGVPDLHTYLTRYFRFMPAPALRNIIMYSVVSAVLIVAAFGIYNIISTVVMEKHKDIAILKSMGYRAYDIQMIFLLQGIILGVWGVLAGLPLGCLLMVGLMQIKYPPPGGTDLVSMPIDWGVPQFLIAAVFAFAASLLASYLPARKVARVLPIDILRGGQ